MRKISSSSLSIQFSRKQKGFVLFSYACMYTSTQFTSCFRYNHYKPYVDRIAAGEKMVLTKVQPHILAVSSGTSGKSSLIPMVKKQAIVFLTGGIMQTMDTMLEVFPGARNMQKSLKFFYTPRERKSEGGITIGPGSSSPKSSKSKNLLLHVVSMHIIC